NVPARGRIGHDLLALTVGIERGRWLRVRRVVHLRGVRDGAAAVALDFPDRRAGRIEIDAELVDAERAVRGRGVENAEDETKAPGRVVRPRRGAVAVFAAKRLRQATNLAARVGRLLTDQRAFVLVAANVFLLLLQRGGIDGRHLTANLFDLRMMDEVRERDRR